MIPGNKEVISTLETYLDIAKKNPVGHVAIVMTGVDIGIAESSGNNALQETTRLGLNTLLEEMDKSIDIYALPETDPGLDASYVCYNAVIGPHGYEFFNWLIDAEMERIREEIPPPLKVGFWQGKGAKLKEGQEGYNWLNNVFRPGLAFIGAVQDDKAIYGHHKKLYGTRDIVFFSENFSEDVPRLLPTFKWATSGYVTITTKEVTDDWILFANYLVVNNHNVIFLTDEVVLGEKFRTYNDITIDSRLSIYENAKCNLFDKSEFDVLALYGSRPYLQFKELDRGFINSSVGWELFNGFPLYEQFPWARDNQRIIWEKTTFDNLKKYWEEYME